MAELTQRVIDAVATTKWNLDTKQDFYVHWLEAKYDEEVFENDAHLYVYINSYMNNTALNNKKVEANRARLERLNADTVRSTIFAASDEDPATLTADREAILIKVNGLSAALRNTLEEYYIEGASPEEIAARNNENVEAVRKRITRARNQLQGETNGR